VSDFFPEPPASGAAGTPASGAPSAAPALPPELNPRGYVRPRRRHRRATRFLAWLATITSLVVLVGSGAMYLAIKKLDGNIVRIAGLPGGPRPERGSGEDENFLIVGSDSRAGASKAELREFGTEMEAGQRSDTMLLVHIPGDRDGAYVLSFPRDLLVTIPGHSSKSKINAAYSEGGAQLAVQTVESLTSVRIDHYLEVNFANFLRMVDALGGIEMCIPKAMKSSDAALNLKAGKQTLKGRNALAYVRARTFDKDSEYKDASSDIGRIHRQQDFIGAMIRTATSSKTLFRPDRLAKFLDRATKGLKTDEGTTFNDLKKLGLRFRNLDPKRVVFASVPIDNPAGRYRGQSVVLMDELEAEDGPCRRRRSGSGCRTVRRRQGSAGRRPTSCADGDSSSPRARRAHQPRT
jgi:LCP family protein required for cell wall assembly